ncbi:hypothetical protein [Paenibacillus thalictri]|uniref:Fucose isomerase n=1 Tax=Paenibacillus thalictri TaxID=2527873 RepID=A0A4Q9DKM0_9BACL|nr:hypothetical protein [Paenibacillus thalictri]TBL73270.1 hypothetical protein EYB31_26680 [Paenibacillus thalictri]
MIKMKTVFLPVARPTFDVETANIYFEQSKQLLNKLVDCSISPDALLMSPEDTARFIRDAVQGGPVDAVIVQSTTFVDARFIIEIMDATDAPILLWGVREPRVNGTRLSLNSMTGINNLSNSIVARRRKFALLFGNPQEAELAAELHAQLKVVRLMQQLKQLKIGVIGSQPDGFLFSHADPDMLAKLGPQLIELNLQDVFAKAAEVPEQEVQLALQTAAGQVKGLSLLPEEGVVKFSRFQTALLHEIRRLGISMVAVRCWPEFFTEYGAAACSTVSSLIESGVMASCEADIHGAITMYIQHQLAQNAPYLGDLVHIDESKDSGVFWHCGAGAFSLARADTGAVAGLHPNRKLGFTLEFGLKAGEVSVNRLGPDPFKPGAYRMLMLSGEALDEPQKFWGTSVEVGFGQPIVPLMKKLMLQGFEPHYSIVYANINKEVGMLCDWLDVEKNPL